MELTTLEPILEHEESYRAVCASLRREKRYVVITNPDLSLPETNCVIGVRLGEGEVPGFVDFVRTSGLAVVLDSASRPKSLASDLTEAGYSSRGRRYVAVLDPESLVAPPGGTPHFTPVGPSELGRFVELAAGGETGGPERTLWSFRLRNLLFTAYLAETPDGSAAAFSVFHCGELARLDGPFPLSAEREFVFACRLVAKAWERAQAKGARDLYTLVREGDVDRIKPLGFQVDESFWIETYS